MGVGGEWVRGWFGPQEVISLSSLTRTTEGSTTSAGHQSEFALRLYEGLRARAGNLCFSPYSIQTALAMVYAGARGETADQMRRVLEPDHPFAFAIRERRSRAILFLGRLVDPTPA